VGVPDSPGRVGRCRHRHRRAIIRDLYPGAKATRLLSLVTMIFSIGPAIAPILGGWIVKLLDWRSIFLFMFGYTVLLLWYCFRKLPETLPASERRPFKPRLLAESYWRVFTSVLFQLNAGAGAFSFAGLFLFVAAAPVFVTQHLGLDQREFYWQFIPAVGGIFMGAAAANRLAGRISVTSHMALGFAIMVGAAGFNVGYHAFYPPGLPWSVVPLFFHALGFSMLMPVVTLVIMDLFPAMRGLVASCQAFTQTMLGAVTAGVVAPFLSHSVLWLAAGQLACALIALVLWFAGRAYHHAREEGKVNAWETVPLD
jgi:DHA1 family bicyclomycin/chloramphenicol resistance-like MFS transporter